MSILRHRRNRSWPAALAMFAFALVFTAGEGYAQCSSGMRGMGTTPSTSSLTRLSNPGAGLRMPSYGSRSLATPLGYEMQRQLQLTQLQIAAARLQLQQQQARRYQDQQALLSMRRERAERTRERRAQRIARAKAKREAERSGLSPNSDQTVLTSL